jgi:hypothetical protein
MTNYLTDCSVAEWNLRCHSIWRESVVAKNDFTKKQITYEFFVRY